MENFFVAFLITYLRFLLYKTFRVTFILKSTNSSFKKEWLNFHSLE